MTGEVYIEDSVEVKNNSGARVMFGLSIFCLVISFAGMMWANILFAIPFVVFIFLTYHFYYERNVAFDYTYTNGLFEVAKVRGNSKRKKLYSAEFESLEILAYDDNPVLKGYEQRNFNKVIKAYVGMEDRKMCIAVFNVEGKQTKIIFEPSEEMLAGMKRQYPVKVMYSKY